jgi:hypothetical protein
MTLLKIWGAILVVSAAYLLLCAEMDYRAARIERCAVVRCA